MTDTIRPRLVVPDVDEAIAYYVEHLGAERGARYAEPSGHVVHAELCIGRSELSLTQAHADWGLSAPSGSGGSPVLLTLTVTDASAVGAAMVAGGATVLIPIEDRSYGLSEGRLRDPFGHLWIVSQDLPGRP
ncbi:VOC family protein [Geodermatophilus sp. DSM 44513]|uniref:VOC family protein n=1 Tax=Geodermatophilus sp. DSM 44513 TaxID=1528104 RepID=UPI0012764C5F|nr:VOC family protein [Geodermatophilus sp. DSM 44513]WNV76833.1 VOC family protein [Geodermatophilus sp. DSM 44513]